MITIKNLKYILDDKLILSNINFSINKSDRIGIVGRNGSGKTTLLKIIAGKINQSEGEVLKTNKKIELFEQDTRKWSEWSVHDYIEKISGVKDAKIQFNEICTKISKNFKSNSEKYQEALDRYLSYDVANFDINLKKVLQMSNIFDIDIKKPLSCFSGGERTKIALAAIFASKQDIILLDEPTNNLDGESINNLERFILQSYKTFVIVSHDRNFLRNVSNKIIELSPNGDSIRQYNLGYEEYIKARETEKKSLLKNYSDSEKKIKNLNKTTQILESKKLKSFKKSNNKHDKDKLASNFKNEKAQKGLHTKIQSLKQRISIINMPAKPQEEVSLNFLFINQNNKKINLLDIKDLIIEYANGVRIGPFSLQLANGERILIEGKNGSGKTSLAKAILGICDAKLTGKILRSTKLKTVYINQEQILPLMDRSAFDNLSKLAPHLDKNETINLLLRFNMKKDILNSIPVTNLSGGERAKILLASAAANEANLIILDEPTNNLDIYSIEALENALKQFTGAILLISHDKEFIKSINEFSIITI